MTEFVLGKIKFTWQGNWAVSTAYEKDDIVKYGGNTYVCTIGHTSSGIIPDFYVDIAKWDIHVEGVTHKGDHADATFYKVNDIVKGTGGGYQGVSLYICTTQHTSTATINLSNFTLYIQGVDVPVQTGKSGQFLSTDGTNTTWVDIVEAAPGALDTLNELAASLADDPDFAGTITTALAGKEPTLTAGTTAQYYRGDKTWQTLTVDPTMGGDLSGLASAAQIVAGAVGTAEIATDAVTANEIATDAVTANEIATDAVGSAEIAANAVGSAEIAANAVGVIELNVTDGTSGQALMTDGAGTMTFGDVDALPTQTSNAGKFLTTDGIDSSWGALSVSAGAVSDQANTSTTYFDIPAGTTAQRPGAPAMGNMRFNSESSEMEHYSGTGWVGFAGSIPVITSIGPTTAATTGTAITINGANFSGSSTVQIIGTDNSIKVPQSVTFVDINTLSITTPELTVALEPYDVRVTNPDGQYYTLVDSLDAGGVPAWTTAAGSLGTMFDAVAPGSIHYTLVAGDPDGATVTYTETTNVLSTAGLTLNSTTGAITGDAPTAQSPNAATTYNFDVDASDSVNVTSRSFSITVSDLPSGGTTATYLIAGVGYKSHTFTGTGVFLNAANLLCDVLVVAGGGSGGNAHTTNGNGGGGAGGMVVASDYTMPSGSHNMSIGGGGAYSSGSANVNGSTGSVSIVQTTPSQFIAVGGGGGSGQYQSPGTGLDGGSGGGGSKAGTGPSSGAGGNATQDSAGTQHNPGLNVAAYGNIGGASNSSGWNGAGGGGAGTPGRGYGGSAPYNNAGPESAPGGNGGTGIQCDFKDGGSAGGSSPNWYAGGGGGGGNSSEHSGDGYHGGGRGFGTCPSYSASNYPVQVNGTTFGSGTINAIINTGGGGGAGSYWANNISGSSNTYGGGAGGSGIIVVRYKT